MEGHDRVSKVIVRDLEDVINWLEGFVEKIFAEKAAWSGKMDNFFSKIEISSLGCYFEKGAEIVFADSIFSISFLFLSRSLSLSLLPILSLLTLTFST